MAQNKIVLAKINQEKSQDHSTRVRLFRKLKRALGMPLLAFYTSFRYPVAIEDSDAEMLESVLQTMDTHRGFALMISSPGGSGLAAERIANVCRCYSGTGKYLAIVAGKAKSAATIVCLGAEKILMGPSSELGTIDPQVVVEEDGKTKWFSVHNIVRSYEELFTKAVEEKGNLHPYLQQLEKYDAREIQEMKAALLLTEDMAVKLLKTGMVSELSEDEIRQKIELLLTPKELKVHGRPLYARDAIMCGLTVQVIDQNSQLWATLHELHVRLNAFVSSNKVAKCIETEEHSFIAQVGGGR